MRSWTSWDEPDRDVAVVRWEERDIAVVFPLPWAARHGMEAMVARSKARIEEMERKAGRTLAPGSVVLAFSRHEEQPPGQSINPDVPKSLLPMVGV